MGCRLCPRACDAQRDEDVGIGICGMGTRPKLARAAVHMWEEPCISGVRGSGTVFFSGCTLRCAYCQNMPISHGGAGRVVTVERLKEIFRELCDKGVHNINLVTGTQFVPAIISALNSFRPPVPIVWNTSGYETKQTLERLEGYVDVYLTDVKHVSSRLSSICAGAPDYFVVASAAVKAMCAQTGAPVYDEQGMMLRGTLVRHLILPGCTSDAMRVLDFVAGGLPGGTPVSLMRQYSPVPECTVKGLDRPISDREYHRLLAHFKALGLSGYTQEKRAATLEYTPAFDLTGV